MACKFSHSHNLSHPYLQTCPTTTRTSFRHFCPPPAVKPTYPHPPLRPTSLHVPLDTPIISHPTISSSQPFSYSHRHKSPLYLSTFSATTHPYSTSQLMTSNTVSAKTTTQPPSLYTLAHHTLTTTTNFSKNTHSPSAFPTHSRFNFSNKH